MRRGNGCIAIGRWSGFCRVEGLKKGEKGGRAGEGEGDMVRGERCVGDRAKELGSGDGGVVEQLAGDEDVVETAGLRRRGVWEVCEMVGTPWARIHGNEVTVDEEGLILPVDGPSICGGICQGIGVESYHEEISGGLRGPIRGGLGRCRNHE